MVPERSPQGVGLSRSPYPARRPRVFRICGCRRASTVEADHTVVAAAPNPIAARRVTIITRKPSTAGCRRLEGHGSSAGVGMSEERPLRLRFLLFLALLLVAAGVGRTADAPEPCCYANDRYMGVCRVVPEPGERCLDILNYLNNPGSTGKTYCGATTVRGGWSQVSCSEGTQTTSGGSSDRTRMHTAGEELRQVPRGRPR